MHNYGTNDIDLTGYSWNDDSHGGFSGADTASFSGFTIHSNETIIVTEQKGVVTDAGTFRTWWGLGSSVQVVVLNSADPGLGASPIVSGTKRTDSVRLWRTIWRPWESTPMVWTWTNVPITSFNGWTWVSP